MTTTAPPVSDNALSLTDRLGYTARELMKITGTPEKTIRAAFKSGAIPYQRIGWQMIVPTAVAKSLFPNVAF